MVHPHDLYSNIEPWTRRIKAFAKELARRNNQVKLAYFPRLGTKIGVHFHQGYEVIPLNRFISPGVFLNNTRALMQLAGWADLVHFQKCHHYAAVPAVLAAFLKGKPLHYDWDDWEEMIWYESCGRGMYARFIGISFKILERFLPVLADTVSVSSALLGSLALKTGVNKDHIYSASVGADLNEFSPDTDSRSVRSKYAITGPLLLYIGQLNGAQYIDLFIRAAQIILKDHPKAKCMIVGEGFMEDQLKSLAKALGVEDKILFTGSVAHHLIPEYIAAADICVAPFKNTPVTRCKSPLKIVEYMSMGKAIVASDVGEVHAMLEGAGMLVKEGDCNALAKGISRLLDDEPLRKQLGAAARRKAEAIFNWPQTVDSLCNAYASLIGQKDE